MHPTPTRVAVITGASSGIGYATAEAFARQGWAVVLAARRTERITALAEQIIANGGTALVVPTDVTQADDRAKLIAQTLAHFGRLDVLVNNAGRGHFGRTADLDIATIREVFELNVIAPIMLTQLALPELQRQRGMVINIASIAGRVATPPLNVYNATKFALIGWTEATRRELRRTGVRLCIVDPGPINTEFSSAAEGSHTSPGAKPSGWPATLVARRIVRLVRHPRREIIIPRIYGPAMWLNHAFPAVIDWIVGRGLPQAPQSPHETAQVGTTHEAAAGGSRAD